MVAYLRHVVQPLEAQRFDVVVCGDLRIAVAAAEDVAAWFSDDAATMPVVWKRLQSIAMQSCAHGSVSVQLMGKTRRVCLCPSGKLGGTECGLTTCWQIICQSGAS